MSRYVESYKRSNLAGPGDSRPTAMQITEDENLINKLHDKTFLVTGISGGIGIETMRVLQATRVHICGTVRSLEKGKKVVDEILAKNPNGGKLDLIEMNLESFGSIQKGTEEFLNKSSGRLSVLINNAGIMAVPKGLTKDGFELHFGTSHLSHFLLFQLLRPALLSYATPEYPPRVVSVSSGLGHQDYEKWAAYDQSKTANIWLANTIERKYGNMNLHATVVHPGGIVTNFNKDVLVYFKSSNQGAATQIYAAVSEEWKRKSGKYLSDVWSNPRRWVCAMAYDEDSEERLWKESFEMVGLKQK
ncbi:NAD(P)-binding protein [Lojkania enalia]|uniref:NAD(P)-binding protein n=1 Tax=Lojkania enalia TaxID=147567 RepID=A0A9P4N2V9_9PLEO|nr:NAD(P)-binding protein [Didymosphaeria enalia]